MDIAGCSTIMAPAASRRFAVCEDWVDFGYALDAEPGGSAAHMYFRP
ncbi:MAG: hypothetical protein Q4A71_06645 [Actinomycetaceae bacterium]|nr:hypothetical protein [Actinomycetaceae bacterium]